MMIQTSLTNFLEFLITCTKQLSLNINYSSLFGQNLKNLISNKFRLFFIASFKNAQQFRNKNHFF